MTDPLEPSPPAKKPPLILVVLALSAVMTLGCCVVGAVGVLFFGTRSAERVPAPTEVAEAGDGDDALSPMKLWVGGSLVGELETDGSVWKGGSRIGELEPNGRVWKGGSQIGEIEADGKIWRGGSQIGEVEEDGKLWLGGSKVGEIEPDGKIWLKGSQWGEAEGYTGSAADRRAVVAWVVFYSGAY